MAYRITNDFDSRLSPVYMIQPVVKPVWQPGKCLYTRYNRLSNPLSSGCETGLTTDCIVYTNIQPETSGPKRPLVETSVRQQKLSMVKSRTLPHCLGLVN